jgi:membrane fusion protein, heavy metal efflux system
VKKLFYYFASASIFLFGCGKNSQDEQGGDHGHPHAGESGLHPLSYTLYTDSTELFVEFKPLVVGQVSRFAAHLTELTHFKPFTEGTVTVSLSGDGKILRHTVNAPTSPGIFRPQLTPKNAGKFTLTFDIKRATRSDKIVIPDVIVYPDEKTAIENQEEEKPGNEISYLKEQAWKVDFEQHPVNRQPFNQVIRTSGQIVPAQGDEMTITAKTSGIVKFAGSGLLAGTQVRAGELLFTISGSGVTDANIDVRVQEARANYEKAKADYERAKELVKDKIISEREFQEAKVRYETTRSIYNSLAANYGPAGQRITATTEGFVKNIQVKEGQYVEVGQPLITISKNRKLIIRADVSQRYLSVLPDIVSANFKTAYSDAIYSTDELNGKLASYGRNTSENSFSTPVFFEVDNKGDLVSGSFVEMYLKTRATENALVVPATALLEEQGNYYVYVQVAGESFEKREVQLGGTDGRNVHVLSGIKEGERVVTQGGYQIKLSTLSGTLPAHGHEH